MFNDPTLIMDGRQRLHFAHGTQRYLNRTSTRSFGMHAQAELRCQAQDRDIFFPRDQRFRGDRLTEWPGIGSIVHRSPVPIGAIEPDTHPNDLQVVGPKAPPRGKAHRPQIVGNRFKRLLRVNFIGIEYPQGKLALRLKLSVGSKLFWRI